MIILSIQAIFFFDYNMMRRRRTRRPNAPAFSSQADFTQNKTPEQVGGFILVIPPRLLAFARG